MPFTARADWVAESALAYREHPGDVVAFRGAFWADYLAEPQAPLPWRAKLSGGGPAGVVGDLEAHLFDLAIWLLGVPIERVRAHVATVFPERENPNLAGILAQAGVHWASWSFRVYTRCGRSASTWSWKEKRVLCA
ncbi:Gfo/Idh/MocA family oxidoreductase [Calidithermus timidus]|jgi:predicted dehydrogenase|uniref:Gfo/Idh/MocA family protein n=1 Tax=Calidithermus timidus TaxID=307124 RepID=UPI0009FC6176